MPSGLWSNLLFLTDGETETQREVLLVVEMGLEFRSPDSQMGKQHDAEKRVFKTRKA